MMMIEEPRVSVLIVDDDPDKRLALRAALEPLDLSIVEADSGMAALRSVMAEDFAVILLDVRMDGMDGFETAALIRERRQSEMTPIIFITAYAVDELDASSIYENGAVDFLFAPIVPEELRGKVSAFANLFIRAANLAAASRQVQTSADQLALLTDAAPIGIFQTDGQGAFVYTNPRWSELTGVSAEQVTGQTWESLIRTCGWKERSDGGSSRSLASESRQFEIWTEGVCAVLLMTSEAIPGNEGGVSGWVGTLADVTTEVEADKEKEKFSSLVQNSRDVIAIVNSEGMFSYVSPAIYDISGYSSEEVVGRSGFDFIHPDDVEIIASHLSEISATQDEVKRVEVRTRTKSGSWIWIEIRAMNRIDDPSIEGIVLNYHDITSRREALNDLADSEKLLADGQALSHVGSFTWEMDTGELNWSDEQYRLLGFDRSDVRPTFDKLVERIHPDDRARFTSLTQDSMDTGAPFDMAMRIVSPDGKDRWIQSKGEVVFEGGRPRALVGMSLDITARKEAEDERLILLAQQKYLATQFRMLLDSTGEGIYGLDVAGACTFMNKAGAALLGGVAADFVGQNMHRLTHHSHPDGSLYEVDDCPIYTGLLTGGSSKVNDDVLWRLDGVPLPVNISSYPIGGEGSKEGAVVTFEDVSTRQLMERDHERLEAQLRQAQKMEAVGQLAGGVAHDFNNILAVVLNYAEFVSETLDEDHEGRADLDQIVKAGQRGAELVHQLLAFSRQEIIQPRVADLNEIISGMAILLDRSVGEEVSLKITASEDLRLAKVDKGQIEQILLNLVVNARDALSKGGGLITVATNNEDLRTGERVGLETGRYVCLTVTDNGTGIDPEVIDHIFEPFFTTKPRGEGTGLGLATVYGIVKRAGGGIFAESPGSGTIFSVYLPVTADVESAVESSVIRMPGSTEDTETIMVVEDEAAVRDLIVRILSRSGFRVLEASSGQAALELLGADRSPVDLLLTDIVMPEMSGPALRDLIHPLRPDMAVLFMSGYIDELIAKRGVLGDGELLLNKPFNAEQLLEGVRESLSRGQRETELVEVSE